MLGSENTARAIARALVVAAAAGGILLPAFSVSGEISKPPLEVIAPGNGAVMAPGKALVIGRVNGGGHTLVQIDVNGSGKMDVPVTRGGFSATVPLPAGKNILRVTAGRSSVSLAVTGDAKGTFRYHAGVEKCGTCHDGKTGSFSVEGRKEEVCYRCHGRQDGGKNLHGPLGSGECTACHDPHGSGNAALTVARQETMCLSCHDQESSGEHMKRSRGKACTECHDPHSSDKPFLRR